MNPAAEKAYAANVLFIIKGLENFRHVFSLMMWKKRMIVRSKSLLKSFRKEDSAGKIKVKTLF